MTEVGDQEDLVSNRLTVVPALGIYSAAKNSSGLRGRIGVTASNITCGPEATDTEPSSGVWVATRTSLEGLMNSSESGPRSGQESEYKEQLLAYGKHRMMVSTDALIGVVNGSTAWGESNGNSGRLLVWKWSFDDIDEVMVGRMRKMMKMWDGELTVTSKDPKAFLHYSGYGTDPGTFYADGSLAKAAKKDGSHLLGFAQTLTAAVARHRGMQVNHTSDGGPKEPVDVFTFS